MNVNYSVVDKKLLDTITDLKLEELKQKKDIYFGILSNGMRHIITTKDKILVRKVATKQLNIGDIMVYERKDGKFTVHRIVSKQCENGQTIFITKADANRYIDPPVSEEQVMGKVIAVKKPAFFLRLDTIPGEFIGRFIYGYSSLYCNIRFFMNKCRRKIKRLLKRLYRRLIL